MTGASRIIAWLVLLTSRGRRPTSTAATSSSSLVNSTSHRRFADELTTALYSRENECSSALGVSMAFSLIYPGCTGDAIVQISDVLGFDGNDNMQLAWRDASTRMLASADGRCVGGAEAPLLKIANGIWFDEDRSLNADYERAVRNFAKPIDLSAVDSSRIVNEWVEERTNGLIKSIVEPGKPLYPPHELVAINSIYLKASWQHPFDEGKTNLDSFHGSENEESSQAHFMNGVFDGVSYSHEALPGHQVVRLPFAESQMSMIFVLPMTTGVGVIPSSELLPALDNLQSTRVALSIPKFKFESTYDDALKSAIVRTGIASPFAGGSLCGIFANDPDCRSLFVDKVVQKTAIDVHENGMEAAAATAIMTGRSGGMQRLDDPVKMVCDRPFRFFIVDESEGLVLFEGRVGRPALPDNDPARPLLEGKHSEGDFWFESFGVNPADPPPHSVASVASEEYNSPSSGAVSSSAIERVRYIFIGTNVYSMLGFAMGFLM